MYKIYKSKIDNELKEKLNLLDVKDAYRWALICSEHALNYFDFKESNNINKALMVINNNLDTIDINTAKEIAKTIDKEAQEVENINLELHFMLKAFAHTVATLFKKESALYSAIFSCNAIYQKTNEIKILNEEKLYQLEKLDKFLMMYDN